MNNSTTISQQELIDYMNQGKAQEISDLGCNETWERNIKKAQRDGLPGCVHCGRGVDIQKGWAIHLAHAVWDFALANDINETYENSEWILVGPTCGPRLVSENLRVKARTVSKFRDATVAG